jgi:hypothetical protein
MIFLGEPKKGAIDARPMTGRRSSKMNEFNKMLEKLQEAYAEKFEGRGEPFHMEDLIDTRINEIKMEMRAFVRRNLK